MRQRLEPGVLNPAWRVTYYVLSCGTSSLQLKEDRRSPRKCGAVRVGPRDSQSSLPRLYLESGRWEIRTV